MRTLKSAVREELTGLMGVVVVLDSLVEAVGDDHDDVLAHRLAHTLSVVTTALGRLERALDRLDNDLGNPILPVEPPSGRPDLLAMLRRAGGDGATN
jgi:hypothetical protein